MNKRITAVVVFWVFANAWASLGAGNEPWKIDYDRSMIEITGTALGFVPSIFSVTEFQAAVKSDADPLVLKGAEVTFSYADLSSGYANRDRKIHNWLEAERFPEGRFSLLEVEEVEGSGSFVALGELKLHGVTKAARFVCDLDEVDGRLILKAEAKIDYREWGLPPLRILLFKVNHVLKISLQIEGHASSS